MRCRVLSNFCLFSLGLLTACSRRETPAAAGIRTGTLLLGNQNEPASLDPHVVDALTDMNVLVALFEGLTVLNEKDSQALPGVAERWDVSPDGREYTFHLRGNARWSNGDAVNAGDFVYSFERMLLPKFGAAYSYMLWPIKNAEAFNSGKITDFAQVGVRARDPVTLQIMLERPTPYLPALAGHGTWLPVHRATIEKFGPREDRNSRWTRAGNLVGNGPFTLAEWAPNSRIRVTKNPHYWDAARNQLNEVVFLPIENTDTEERNFRAGQLHLTFDSPKGKYPAYAAASPSPLRVDPLLNITYLNFNVKKAPFTDPRVRRALSLAIDREAISRAVLNGAWPAAHSFIPPNCGGYSSRARVETDFEQARRLLAEAGFPGGRNFPSIPIQVLNDADLPRVMEAIQAMWQRELGVRLTIEPFEQKTLFQNQQTGAHTLATLGWTADFADPATFFGILVTGNGNNWTGWSSAEYDRLIAVASNTADPRARFELLHQAEALLLEAAPIAPLVNRTLNRLAHPAVKNWEPSPLGVHRYQLIRLEP
ncbi:MAG: hypothetical protein RIQ93_1557 [Verrucomicrobiota bacterium]|jgi:oligopeptide transport system substrate-binding protein